LFFQDLFDHFFRVCFWLGTFFTFTMRNKVNLNPLGLLSSKKLSLLVGKK